MEAKQHPFDKAEFEGDYSDAEEVQAIIRPPSSLQLSSLNSIRAFEKRLQQIGTNLQILSLQLTWNNLGTEGVSALRFITQIQQLHTLQLNLTDNELGSKGSENLAQLVLKDCHRLQNLKLELSNNDLKQAGVKHIAQALAKLPLQALDLDLSYNGIGADGTFELAAEGLSRLGSLRRLQLNLCENFIREQGAMYLSLEAFPQLLQLTHLQLQLQENDLGVRGVQNIINKGISEMTALQNLSIDFASNDIGAKGVQTIFKNGLAQLSNLSSLSLGLEGNRLSKEGLLAFTLNEYWPSQLTKLQLFLANNEIDTESMINFTNFLFVKCAPKLEALTIEIQGNEIGAQGARHLLQKGLMIMKKLKIAYVNIASNSIEEEDETDIINNIVPALQQTLEGAELTVVLESDQEQESILRESVIIF